MLVTFLSSLVLRFSTSCYGCHQLEPDVGVSQQVSKIYPSKPALCSFWDCLPTPEDEFHAMLVTFLSSFVLRFSTSCYGCHQLAPDLGVSHQVSTIYPSKLALCSFWRCLPHPEVQFHAMLVTFLSSSVLRISNSCYGCRQLAPDLGVSQQVSTIHPSKPALCSFWRCLPHPEVEFHAMLVTLLSSLVVRFITSCYGCHQLAPDLGVSQQVSTICPFETGTLQPLGLFTTSWSWVSCHAGDVLIIFGIAFQY